MSRYAARYVHQPEASPPATSCIALIGCGKEKVDHLAPARDLYTGDLFTKALAHVEANFELAFVLSAKHGLLDLDRVVHPYDETLRDYSENDRAEWAHRVLAWQLAQRFDTAAPLELVVFAGATYVEPLSWQMPEFPAWTLTVPLQGLGIGERKAWFNARRAA